MTRRMEARVPSLRGNGEIDQHISLCGLKGLCAEDQTLMRRIMISGIWSQTSLAQSRRLYAGAPALQTDRWCDAFLPVATESLVACAGGRVALAIGFRK